MLKNVSEHSFQRSSSSSSSPSNKSLKSSSYSGKYSDTSTVVAVSYFNHCDSLSSKEEGIVYCESTKSGYRGLIISNSTTRLDQLLEKEREKQQREETLKNKVPSFIVVCGASQKNIDLNEAVDSDLSSDDEKQKQKKSGESQVSKKDKRYSDERDRVRQKLFERMGNRKV